MKNIVILGSGNAFNSDGRGHTSFLLDDKILIDCGPTILLKIESLRIEISNLELILITHFHGDHFGGIPFLLIYLKYILHRSKPLTIIGPKNIKEKCLQLMELFYPQMDLPYELNFIEISSVVSYHDYFIQALPITHKEESIGYRILDEEHSFAFTGDTIIDEKVYDLLYNIDIAIMEVSLWENPERRVQHVSLKELIENRKKIKAKKLFFNHLTNRLAEKIKEISKEDPNFGTPLEDGMIIAF